MIICELMLMLLMAFGIFVSPLAHSSWARCPRHSTSKQPSLWSFLPLKTIKQIKGTMARWCKKQFVVHPPKGCRMYKPQALYCGIFLNQPNFVCVDFCMHQVRTLPGRCWERESQCLTQWFEFWVSCSVDCRTRTITNWKGIQREVESCSKWWSFR